MNAAWIAAGIVAFIVLLWAAILLGHRSQQPPASPRPYVPPPITDAYIDAQITALERNWKEPQP
ncbi:hypothetical protein [Kitasatospora sp. A2-31]|uniref:hypothetical protein n=1 Tax=Kitasatospora sp. A2-31 TaxID=2916414 RepID=UPI001EE8B052|nr:hypothetical protein [Kitasatospora sp. A2-31]MCG6493408.1 hypothetical protein [Kitasatospora sp. A2-31]